jgi:ubiquinone/menaquinone biosynthesis C-methylase UbiE
MSDFIKQTWDDSAEKHKESHWASWGDNFAMSLEVENISKYIKNGDNVLDVGCANGFSTFEQFEKNKIKIQGVDFSTKMIECAEEQRIIKKLGNNISFSVGDVRNLSFKNNLFDLTYTTRVIINLPTWEEQIKGIIECIRVTKKDGIIVLSEAFWEPLVLLNSLRTIKNLAPLMEHDFNRYLKKQKVEDWLTKNNIKFEIIDFSSIYYLGSRFLRELVTKIDDYPGYSNPINEIFYNIEKEYSGGGFGIQQACVIYK